MAITSADAEHLVDDPDKSQVGSRSDPSGCSAEPSMSVASRGLDSVQEELTLGSPPCVPGPWAVHAVQHSTNKSRPPRSRVGHGSPGSRRGEPTKGTADVPARECLGVCGRAVNKLACCRCCCRPKAILPLRFVHTSVSVGEPHGARFFGLCKVNALELLRVCVWFHEQRKANSCST